MGGGPARRRRRDRPAARPGRTSCRSGPQSSRPGSGWPPGPRGTPTPATRSGRRSDRRRSRGTRRAQRGPAARPAATASAVTVRPRVARSGRGVRSGDPVLRSDPPSTLVQEPFYPVTGPESGAPERGTGAPPRPTGTQGAVGAVLIVLALGLAFRLIIAYLLPGSGFDVDLASFRFWADDLARERPVRVLRARLLPRLHAGLPVRPVAGRDGRASGRGHRRPDQDPADPRRPRARLAGLVDGPRARRPRPPGARSAAAVVMVNPISWFDSVVWGQVDSFGVVFLLLGLRELWRDRPERAAIFTVIAAIIKPQLGILIPIVAVVTIRRALRPVVPPTEPAADAGRLRRLEAETGRARPDPDDRPRRFLTALALCLPFGLTVLGFDRGRPVRLVGAARADRARRWRLSVPDGQRLQRVGARPERPREQPGRQRPVDMRRGEHPGQSVRGRDLAVRGGTGGRRRGIRCWCSPSSACCG